MSHSNVGEKDRECCCEWLVNIDLGHRNARAFYSDLKPETTAAIAWKTSETRNAFCINRNLRHLASDRGNIRCEDARLQFHKIDMICFKTFNDQ